jgi:ATP-dependent DNA ligase
MSKNKSQMNIAFSHPILVSQTSKGNQKFWQQHVVTDGIKWYTQTTYWQINKEGKQSKVQSSEPYEATPKNVGKSNETSAENQAYLEAASAYEHQKDKGYHIPGTHSDTLPLPMLAQKFSERSHTLTWPVWCQPKLNGMRMLHDGTKSWSRGGKLIIPECVSHLQFDTKGFIVDGELILPGNVKLQKTMKAATKFDPKISPKLQYFIYDIVIPDKSFGERMKIVVDMIDSFPLDVVFLTTLRADSPADVMKYHKLWTSQGYEGTMIRNDDEGYVIGHRSNQLQKYKDFVDAEFKIISVKEGDGKFKGCAIFKCLTEDGTDDFDCTPEGTMEYRRELWEKKNDYIGKWLTVRYQELTEDKKPLFPVGVTIREREDF